MITFIFYYTLHIFYMVFSFSILPSFIDLLNPKIIFLLFHIRILKGVTECRTHDFRGPYGLVQNIKFLDKQ